jgi:hypothetical protein
MPQIMSAVEPLAVLIVEAARGLAVEAVDGASASSLVTRTNNWEVATSLGR